MRIAVVDDERTFRHQIASMISSLYGREDVSCFLYSDGAEVIRAFENDFHLDAVFLDIEMKELDREVSEYEPHLALEGGADGLMFYESIFGKAYKTLAEGGAVMVEHGYLQGEAVRELCAKAGFEDIITLRDYGGNDRVTAGFKHAG